MRSDPADVRTWRLNLRVVTDNIGVVIHDMPALPVRRSWSSRPHHPQHDGGDQRDPAGNGGAGLATNSPRAGRGARGGAGCEALEAAEGARSSCAPSMRLGTCWRLPLAPLATRPTRTAQ